MRTYKVWMAGCLLACGLAASACAATNYKIDINVAGSSATMAGWTGLDAAYTGGGGSVTVDGVTFATFSADGARLRGTVGAPNPNALLGDFAYDDGNGESVGLLLGGAGSLQAGTWEVDVYSCDATSPPGVQIVAYRVNTAERFVSTTTGPSLTGPAFTFRFLSDGVSAYDVFLRDNDAANRARINAVELRYLGPAPSAGYSVVVLEQNPLEYYRMDTSTGEKGDSIVRNAVTLSQSAPSPALSATGSPAYVGFGTNNTWATFDGSTTAYLSDLKTGWSSSEGTVSYWVRIDSTGDGTKVGIMGRKTGGTGDLDGHMTGAIGTYMRSSDGSFGINIDQTAGSESGAGVLTMNEWHHLAFTWKRNTGSGDGVIRVYCDGLEEGAILTASWTAFTVDDQARFGQEITLSGRKLKGSADEIAVWNRMLTPKEVLTQYWRGVKKFAAVELCEGFQNYTAGSADLNGQGGWSGSTLLDVRSDLSSWSQLGGEWAYLSGSGTVGVIDKTIGPFAANNGGIVTIEFGGRANGTAKSLLGLGVAGTSFEPFMYLGADGANVRCMPYDGDGASHNTTAVFTSAQTQLMRMRLVVDASAGKGSFSYFNGTSWQAPAALQNLELYLRAARSANNPARWDAIQLNGGGSGCWDNLAIIYEPPPGTIFTFR